MRIRGGVDAPSQARKSVLSHLEDYIAPPTAWDVAVVVSELVTNSVLHANVGASGALTVELMTLGDRVRISVIDPGSQFEPQVRPPDHEGSGGLGLFIVDQLSEAWGTEKDRSGQTRVWCDVLVYRSPSSEPRAVAGESLN